LQVRISLPASRFAHPVGSGLAEFQGKVRR